VVADGYALVEGLHDGKVHDSAEIGLTGEDEDEGVVGIHFEIGKKPEFFEGAGLKEMGLIDDEEDGFSRLFFGVQEGMLYLVVDGALGEPWSEAEQTIDVVEEIGPAEGGKGCVEGFEEVFIEGVHIAPESDGFSHPRVSGEEQDAPSSLDVVQACGAFFEGLGIEEIPGLDVFVEGEAFESEPGEEILHGRTLPLWKERLVETF
jgi:hypothetical protein